MLHPLHWELTSWGLTTTLVGLNSLGVAHCAVSMMATEAPSGQLSVSGDDEALVSRRGGRQYAGSPACEHSTCQVPQLGIFSPQTPDACPTR
jgi:hypothetical protein